MLETTLRPRPPYELGRSALWGDPTRRLRDGTFGLVYEADGGPCTAYVRQQPDGSLAVSLVAADEAAAHDRLRWLLAVDVDVAPFLALARQDPLLRDCVPGREGLRPLRLGTVAHALLRALAGQLITSREARSIESAVIRRVSPARHGFHLPPTGAALAALPPAQLARLGLAPRRAATLVRVVRSLDLERLHGVPSELVLARLGARAQPGPLERRRCGLRGPRAFGPRPGGRPWTGTDRPRAAGPSRHDRGHGSAAFPLRRVGRSGELSPPGPSAGSGAQPHGIRTAS